MWLTDGQSTSLLLFPLLCLTPSCFFQQEIGVALTSFGAFFMLLGVLLFFDGGLLALGNVSDTAIISLLCLSCGCEIVLICIEWNCHPMRRFS
jgi:hypothetical protein